MINHYNTQDIYLWHTYTEQIRECRKEMRFINAEKEKLREQYTQITDQESQDESPTPISQKIRPTIQEKLILEQQYQNVLKSKNLIQQNIKTFKDTQIKKAIQNINSSCESIQNEESDQSSDDSGFIEIDGLFSENSFLNNENETYQITQQDDTQKNNYQIKFQTEQQSQHLKWQGIYRNINLRYQKIQKNKVLSQQDIDDILCNLDTFCQNKILLWLQVEFNNLEHQCIYQLDMCNENHAETNEQIYFQLWKFDIDIKIKELEIQIESLKKKQQDLQQKISQLNPLTIKLLKHAIMDSIVEDLFDY